MKPRTDTFAIFANRLRQAVHVAAVVANLSFGIGFARYWGSCNFVKVAIFLMLLFGWFVVSPAIRNQAAWSKLMLFKCPEQLLHLQQKLNERFFPYIYLAVFVWMAFTTWEAPEGSGFRLSDVFRETSK